MFIKKIIVTAIMFITATSVLAQKTDIESVKRSVGKVISQNMVVNNIKDSTAVYSFLFTISITRNKHNKQTVVAELNNPEVNLFFKGLDSLKQINYLPLLNKKRKEIFTFKGYIIVHDSQYKTQGIQLSMLPSALKYLFSTNDYDMKNLGNLVIEFDKKIYN